MIAQELKQKVIDLRKEGKTYNQIHDITGVSKSSISDICRPLKLGGNQVTELTPELITKAQELYDSIGSIKAVAKQVGVGHQRLAKVLTLKTRTQTTRSQSVVSWRKRVKQQLIEYKGGKCECCGYNVCIEALEFHHLNPSEKDFQISGTSKSFETLKKEADKCILVCSNCHREIHAGMREVTTIPARGATN